ncbi:MAG: acetyl-CoA hydrolase [Deltaproteobacteria bacterium RIFOXYA12_FULL_61_11]|nr:MAG: acetyl-CoA hydrolase [Deltaproteobacteria bacterium RIFOXYA12_FULL_61_11]
MQRVSVDQAINPRVLRPGSVVYTTGNAATPAVLLRRLAEDTSLKRLDLFGILLLGEGLEPLFSEATCRRITHRVIFASHLTRQAVNRGWAKYHPMHLSQVPANLARSRGLDAALISVAGPDNGGNYSLGTTVEAVLAAIHVVKQRGGVVIAERNATMPFILGTTIPESAIDYLVDTSYPLPATPVHRPDEAARRIGTQIASTFLHDGSGTVPGSTLQFGIGEVPEAVTEAIVARGFRDLGIHTELFSSGMIRLVQAGCVSNRWKRGINFSVSSIFLAEDTAGYAWFNLNSSVQSRPCDYTNSVFKIAEQPNMVAINSAIGVDLHGNVWADSLAARSIYSGVGGQSDFLRGVQYSPGGVAIIALKATTATGISKIVDKAPAGITTTATPSDRVVLVSEYGIFDPQRLSIGERAVAIAHLAEPQSRDNLLRLITDSPEFHKPRRHRSGRVPGFTPYEEAMVR